MKTVVIVGGGFGGVFTALSLCKSEPLKIILLDKGCDFVFLPLLPDVCLDSRDLQSIVFPLKHLFKDKRISVHGLTVTRIDFERKVVFTEHHEFVYDYVVVCAGSESNYYGVPGAQEFSFTLKTKNDAVRIKHHVQSLIKRYLEDPSKKDLLTFTIVGGGPTGIELAGNLVDTLQDAGILISEVSVTIIEGSTGHMPFSVHSAKSKALCMLRRKGVNIVQERMVVRVDDHAVYTNKGEKIYANTVFWCAGVHPVAVRAVPDNVVERRHFVCEQTLAIVGAVDAFAIGDCAAVPDGKGGFVPKVAQAAVKQGRFVAQNILRRIHGKPLRPFTFTPDGYIVSVGHRLAVAQVGPFVLRGRVAAWLRKLIYWLKIVEIRLRARYGLRMLFG